MALAESVDATYADDPNDASVKQHQADHDALHIVHNLTSVRLVYDSVNAVYPARPAAAAYAEFVGPVDPGAAAADGDTWLDTSA